MDPAAAEIQAFIRLRHPVISAFLITQKADGLPSIRQIGTWVEGWTIQTISRPGGVKMTHLRRNPNATYLFVQQRPNDLSRNVWVQGQVEIVEDPAAVQAFVDRRAAALGLRDPKTPPDAVLLRMRPRFLRSEHFRENPREYVLRAFQEE
jgi:general stress protein 26